MGIAEQIRKAEYRVDPDAVAEAILARIAVPALRSQPMSDRVLVAAQSAAGERHA